MTIAASLPLTKRHESPILLYLQRQKGVLSRRLWLFSEQVFRNPKFKERVFGKQEKVPGTGMRRERRFSYSQQEEPRAKGSGNPECRRRRGRPPLPRTARSGVCGTLPGSRSRGRSSKAKPSNLEVGQKATRQVSGLSPFMFGKMQSHGA